MQENSQTFYHILPNGVKIVHRRTPSPVAYIGVMVGAGTRDEAPEENGMAHYIEHCVFKGTAHHSARQIIHSIEGIGGEINAYTTKEETTFYAAILAEHVQLTLHLIAEMILQPTFKKEETDKERMVILDEIESYNDSPSELIYDDFESLVFDGSSLALPILGTRKTLRHISSKPDYPLQWMQTHYRPERIVVFCQGNVSPEKIFRLAEKEFGALTATRSYSEAVLQAQPVLQRSGLSAHEHERSFKKHTHQVHAMLGGKAYPLGHENQLAQGTRLYHRINLHPTLRYRLLVRLLGVRPGGLQPQSGSGTTRTVQTARKSHERSRRKTCIGAIKRTTRYLRAKPRKQRLGDGKVCLISQRGTRMAANFRQNRKNVTAKAF